MCIPLAIICFCCVVPILLVAILGAATDNNRGMEHDAIDSNHHLDDAWDNFEDDIDSLRDHVDDVDWDDPFDQDINWDNDPWNN